MIMSTIDSVVVSTYENEDDGSVFSVIDLVDDDGTLYSITSGNDEYDTVLNSITAYNDGILSDDELVDTIREYGDDAGDPYDRGTVIGTIHPLTGNGIGSGMDEQYDDYDAWEYDSEDY